MAKMKSMSRAANSRSTGTQALSGLHGLQLVRFSESCTCRDEDQGGHAVLMKSECLYVPYTLKPLEQFSIRTLWEQRPVWLGGVMSTCHGDSNWIQRFTNVLTSLPFVLIGLQAPRKKLVAKVYANSIVGVGVASSLYHISSGEARKIFRWGDYTMIATSAVCMSRALRSDNHMAFMVASAALLPFQPALVTAVHTGLMEATFVRRIKEEPGLKKTYMLHAASTLIGCALFIADDRHPEIPFLHAAWHVAAAIGVATCTKFLN